MSSLQKKICDEIKHLDTVDYIMIILIFFIFVYIIKTYYEQNSEFFSNNVNNDMEKETKNEMIYEEKNKYNFVELSSKILFPKNITISCELAGQIFYLGYIPSGQCISEFDVGQESHTVDCSKYNIVLETPEESKIHNNAVFNISVPIGSKKYDYMIGSLSVFNDDDYIRLSSNLLDAKSVGNLCGDTGSGTHPAWNVNIIQNSVGTNDVLPTFNLCFVVKGELYYITYAEEHIEPCFFNYIKNNVSHSTVLHKATLTKDKILALNFRINEEKNEEKK